MLNFQFTDKERYNTLTVDEKSINDAYVFGCLAIDMSRITEDNAEEWQLRYAFAVDLNGAYYYVNGKEYRPTIKDVRKRIGLTTNCSQRTRKQFYAKQIAYWERNNTY